jgi:hypothetical protein
VAPLCHVVPFNVQSLQWRNFTYPRDRACQFLITT